MLVAVGLCYHWLLLEHGLYMMPDLPAVFGLKFVLSLQLAILNINFACTPNGILVVAFKNIALNIAVIKFHFRRNVYLVEICHFSHKCYYNDRMNTYEMMGFLPKISFKSSCKYIRNYKSAG